MRPDHVIHHVIELFDGWATKEVQDPRAEKEGRLWDEELPTVKPQIVKHLLKDTFDPVSSELLATISSYTKQKEALHDQVKFIYLKSRNNNWTNNSKAKEMRAEVLDTWDKIEEQMGKKIHDDGLCTNFDEGQQFYVTIIGAENLPMFDMFNGHDPYATVVQKPIHLATPELDGRRTCCSFCQLKSAFGKESCEEHKTDWIAGAQRPVWNKKITTILNAGSANLVIAVYNSASRGKSHELLGWMTIPSHFVLYKKPVERTYPLLRADGSLLRVKVQTENGLMQQPALLKIKWKIRASNVKVGPGDRTFIESATPLKGINGVHCKRFKGGASYNGGWQEGIPHGKGTYLAEDGCVYEGEWSWSKMHGQGTFKWSNGDVYVGSWRDNLRHGEGTCRGRNGDVYTGEWRFGMQHGRGRHEMEDGFFYEGEWKDNKAHGIGVVTEPDGQKWDGIFHCGMVVRRNECRPPTPPNIAVETKHEVVSVPTFRADQKTIASLVLEQTERHHLERQPNMLIDSWNIVKSFKGDNARYDEDPRDIHRGFFQRNAKLLGNTPQVQLVISRVETEIDERLLRRETHKDLVKAQRSREQEAKVLAEDFAHAPAHARSSLCTVS